MCPLLYHQYNIITTIMKNELKDLYGRRTTPNVKIFVLVVIILLGLNLAFNGGGASNQEQTDKVLVE